MESGNDAAAYLARLARCLARAGITAEATAGTRPSLAVSSAALSGVEHVIDVRQGTAGEAQYWWGWGAPAGPADDPELTAARIATVLRPVTGAC